MLDYFRNVSQVVNHLVRNRNRIGPAFVTVFFFIVKTMELEMTFGLCDSILTLIVPTNQGTVGVPKVWVEKVLLWW